MASDVLTIPRRGTRVFRVWLLRVLTIGVLPMLAMAIAVLTLVAFDLGRDPANRAWSELSGWLFGALVVVGIVGIIALLDARTRVAGAFALVITLVVNPLTAAYLLLALGLSL